MYERQKIDQLTERVLRFSVPKWRYVERFIVFLSACTVAVVEGVLVLMTLSILTMIFIAIISGSGPESDLYRIAYQVAQITTESLFWALGGLVMGWIVPKVVYELRYGELLWRAIEALGWIKERFPLSFVPEDQFSLDVLNRLVNTQCVPLIDRGKHRDFVRLVITHLVYRQSLQGSVCEELDGLIKEMITAHQARGVGWPIRLKRFFTKEQSFRLQRLADRYDHFFQEWSASYRSAAPRRIEFALASPAIDLDDDTLDQYEPKKQKA